MPELLTENSFACIAFGFVRRFICKNNGVLFENDLLQIGVKSEFRANLGRLGLFYGNKTSNQFSNFSAVVSSPDVLKDDILTSRVRSFSEEYVCIGHQLFRTILFEIFF